MTQRKKPAGVEERPGAPASEPKPPEPAPREASFTDGDGAADVLQRLHTAGLLAPIDLHLGALLLRLEPTQPLVAVAAALTSRAVQAGHVCLDLPFLLAQPLLTQDDTPLELSWPPLSEWVHALSESPLVGRFDEQRRAVVLVLDDEQRLFLQRYADYQTRLIDALHERALHTHEVNESAAVAGLDKYFGKGSTDPKSPRDEQRLAAALALRNGLSIISGGPGTGKTTTVGRLLLLLQEQAASRKSTLKMLLLAPTGKAAQRLSESLEKSLKESGAEPHLIESLPDAASTIHRALGYSTRSPTRFRRGKDNPLSADVVLVDEASMVDLALMTKLVEAVPRGARLILLGDKDQLASVEAGAIFGDIFTAAGEDSYSEAVAAYASRVGSPGLQTSPRVAPIRDCTVHLSRSFRYDEDSGIGHLAKALRQADTTAVSRALQHTNARLIDTSPLSDGQRRKQLSTLIADALADYPKTKDPAERLTLLQRFRLLAAHRHGPLGVEGLNRLTEQTLVPFGLNPTEGSYDGQPIMISSNDYQLELFNGDVGVLARDPETQRLAAYFPSKSGLRRVQLSRLPAHETVFAMTVHKSQGSEFDHVALILPERPSALFTRELLYTGVTRAKRSVVLVGSLEVLDAGVQTPIHRSSGIRDGLQRRARADAATANATRRPPLD